MRIVGGEQRAEAAIGLAGGILGGMAGLSGACHRLGAHSRAGPRSERRVFLQAFNMTILSAMLAASLVQGLDRAAHSWWRSSSPCPALSSAHMPGRFSIAEWTIGASTASCLSCCWFPASGSCGRPLSPVIFPFAC